MKQIGRNKKMKCTFKVMGIDIIILGTICLLAMGGITWAENVVSSFPSPGTSPHGLAWDGNYLWNSDDSDMRIYKINPDTGAIVSSIPTPGQSARGLTWAQGYLWSCDSHATDERIYKINPSNGSVVKSFPAPGSAGKGLAWDGIYLWNADMGDHKIYKINPDTGAVVGFIPSPGNKPYGLTWDGAYLWNSDNQDKKIYRIDSNDGSIIESFPAPDGDPRGLTWDGQYLWNADKSEDLIYKIEVDPCTHTEKSADINGDCSVDEADRSILEASWGLCSKDPGYNDRADLTGDCCVDLFDLTKMGLEWTCGDGICQPRESETSCPEDCGNLDCDGFDCGDINEDGAISGADVVKLQRIINCLDTPTAGQRARADVNGDGIVTDLDVEYLESHLIRLPGFEELKCPQCPKCITNPPVITNPAVESDSHHNCNGDTYTWSADVTDPEGDPLTVELHLLGLGDLNQNGYLDDDDIDRIVGIWEGRYPMPEDPKERRIIDIDANGTFELADVVDASNIWECNGWFVRSMDKSGDTYTFSRPLLNIGSAEDEYQWKIMANDGCNQVSTETLWAKVRINPDLTLLPPQIDCLKVTINGVVFCAARTIEWDWGDGTPIETRHFPATHTYEPEGDCTYTITVTAYGDDEGETQETVVVTLDDTSPETTCALSGDKGHYDWYRSDVLVSLSATDDCSGVDYTKYRIDGGSWQTYSDSFLVEGECIKEAVIVEFYSVDKCGNSEEPHTCQSFKIDQVDPTCGIIINSGAECTASVSVTLTLSASDTCSGVEKMRFSNDAVNWSPWEWYQTSKSWTLTSGDGTKTVYVEYIDRAGNIARCSDDIILDTTPPPAPVISSPTHPEGVCSNNNDPCFEWTEPSDACGIAGYSYKLDNNPSTIPDTDSEGTSRSKCYSDVADGIWYFHVRAKDGAGNWGNTDHYGPVKIDTTPPSAPVISSSTHTEGVWSSNNDPSFTWTEPSDACGICGYSYIFDQNPSTIPDTNSEGTSKSKCYSNVADGTWYFHVRAKDCAGNWGESDHYGPVIITTTPDPALCIEPDPPILDFGETETEMTFEIYNCGDGTLTWELSEGESWITSVNPTSGSSTGSDDKTTVTVKVSRDGLSAGNYSGVITVDPSHGNDQNVTIKMAVLPVITSINPTSGHAVCTPVTIAGEHFGDSQNGSTVTFNGVDAGDADSWSDTEIQIKVPDGATTGPVIVTVNGQSSNDDKIFTVIRPHITGINPPSGPIGTLVTITGENFGDEQDDSKVTFNGDNAGDADSWSDTEIQIKVPDDATTGPVVVTVCGQASNDDKIFTVIPPTMPVITSISPSIGPVGTSVTITGENFSVQQGDSEVTFNGEPAEEEAGCWTDTKILVKVPEGATTGPVIVTVGGQSSNDDKIFTVGEVPPCSFADIDRDCDVDIVDIQKVAGRWNTGCGDGDYIPEYDVDGDGDIDIVDIQKVAGCWNTILPCVAGAVVANTLELKPASPVQVSIQPRLQKLTISEIAMIEVKIENVVNIGAFEVTLGYDNKVIEVVTSDIQLGDFLSNSGRTVAAVGPRIDNQGTFSYGAFSFGESPGPDGDGILARIPLTAKGEGRTMLRLMSVKLTDTNGKEFEVGRVKNGLIRVVPQETVLAANFPNPFNPDTWIPYQLSKDAQVTIEIYSVSGKLIRTLDLGYKEAGFYTRKSKAAYWDGRNQVGEKVASGVYFYHLKAGDFYATRKLLVTK